MTSYTLGGGCFWCLDALYRQITGVTSVESGYSGGTGPAHYERVALDTTGYAEVVRITFDESVIPASVILDLFFLMHNPTTLNRQGADVGTQYRSAMFYADDNQKREFEAARDRAQVLWHKPIVTEITPLTTYTKAEEEHQDFFSKNPEYGYCTVVIEPKITKARIAYHKWFKKENS
jgi:peptide-methionine (S)-S-oxide reductase